MVIGAITIIWFLYKTAKGVLWVLGAGLESCFREKYPYDFQMNLGWVIKEMESHGFRQTSTIDAGSDYPGIVMMKNGTEEEMEVRLSAPLLSTKGYSIIVTDHVNNTAIVMQDSATVCNKELLKKYLS
jgi:hypothetical protein